MKATNWEFTNRAIVFGIIIGVSFGLYVVDQQNPTLLLANWLEHQYPASADLCAHILFALAGLLLAAAALIRTWASAYLNSTVVYASALKSAALVAGGPYRYVRNPLYFANILMAIAMGSMMSRAGFVVCVLAMIVFNYRLIFLEESELSLNRGESYAAYCQAVPRLWPALLPRVPASEQIPSWSAGFKAEAWYWGFALSILAFAVTLQLWVFFVVLAVSLGVFWVSATVLGKK